MNINCRRRSLGRLEILINSSYITRPHISVIHRIRLQLFHPPNFSALSPLIPHDSQEALISHVWGAQKFTLSNSSAALTDRMRIILSLLLHSNVQYVLVLFNACRFVYNNTKQFSHIPTVNGNTNLNAC